VSVEGFAVLATMTLSGSLAILGVLALRISIRHGFGAQIAYAMWIAVPLVVCTVLLPAPTQPVATFMRIAHVGAPALVVVDGTDAAFDPRALLLGLWLAGVGFSALWFVAQQRRYLRSLGRLSVVGEGRDRRVVQSEFDVDGPALVGAWRPRIVLPGDFDQRYAAGERELILAHEHVHMTRGDARINAFVVALRCLNWFNPLVHLAAAKFRLDQEFACDAVVIARFPEARRLYADAMLKVQLAGQPRQELRLPAGCRWPSGHPLKERIAMLKQPLPTRARRAYGKALVGAFGACMAYASWAAQSPSAAAVRPGSTGQVDVRLSIGIGDSMAKVVHLVSLAEVPFSVGSDDPSHPWSIEFTAQPVDDGLIALSGVVTDRGTLIGRPSMMVKPAQTGTIEVGAANGSRLFRIEATLQLREADWKPDVAASVPLHLAASRDDRLVGEAPPPPPPPPPPVPTPPLPPPPAAPGSPSR